MVLLEGLMIALAFFIAYGIPVSLAAWIGSRVNSVPLAFLLGWLATPLVGFLVGVLIELPGPRRDGGGLMILVLPMIGVLTGFVSGIIAAVVVSQRRAKAASANPVPAKPFA